jgi:rubrerythrin
MLFSAMEIIDTAVRIEENGEFFYREFANTMAMSEAKDLLLYLADEEARHRRQFADLTSSINKLEFSMDAPHEEYPGEYYAYLNAFADSHVFTKKDTGGQVAKRFAASNEALEFAIQIELDSVLFYTEMKRFIHNSRWPIVDRIINEERGHYLKLANFQNKIKTKKDRGYLAIGKSASTRL